jgi:hypothetical protein
MLNPTQKYYRKNNIIFDKETDTPIVEFVQKLPDLELLSEAAITWSNKYIELYPNLVNKIDSKTEQLKLF